jgi:A/G-specific adenine glycosylase
VNKLRFQQDLLKWYDHQKRVLPWRDKPLPYPVWISEIMLQQTRVETVKPYFERFIVALPSISSLANVSDDYLNKLWEGLGYYSRARNLKKAAQIMVDKYHANVPNMFEDLITLPGIGPYTAGAILSIAFDQQYTAVDGNVLRVFARITGNKNNIKDPKIKATIKNIVESLLPNKRVGDFNQALMEIGAIVCKPNGSPNCMVCPLQNYCQAFQQNITDIIPLKHTKKIKKIEEKTILIIEYNNRFMIEKRPDKGLLASLYQFPNIDKKLDGKDIKHAFNGVQSIKKLPASTHVFTHLKWKMIGYHVILSEPQKGLFVTIEELQRTYSIPTAFRVYKNYILGGIK